MKKTALTIIAAFIKPLSFQSAADNVDCNDGMKWVEKTQSAMKAAYQEQKKQAQNG